ncbi:uncharacterized protein [Gossypium hirsutum]|uniref:Uncharacterized protein n=1 Tax=Gossypium hirsutum TaxID=3635 RepID=A0ABM3A7T5_GOSHI|nr:uncharacterized protein LOC107887921 [Gossypium hirsutum]
MGLQLIVENGALSERGLRKYLYGGVEVPVLTDKRDYFGLGYKPNAKQKRKEAEKRQERRRARLSGAEIKWEPMSFPHISETFVSAGMIYLESGMTREEYFEDMFNSLSINAILGEEVEEGNLLSILPYVPRSVLNNWTAEEIPVIFRANSKSPDINDASSTDMDPEYLLEQGLCLEGSQDFENDEDYSLSPYLLRMVEREEKQILPHQETIESVTLEEGKEVKIGTCINEKTRQDLIELLREFKDVFAWTYQDMPSLNPDIAVHRVPTKEECKPVQQKLRRMRPDVAVKIREEVKKQFDAGFLQAVNYPEWVANVVHVPKKDGKVQMCMDYRDLNKASPKDNFPLSHIDTLVMPFGLKNARATYQRDMVTLFHDMMHKEIEVYVDDMIAKSRTENEHLQVLKRLFLRLRKFQLKLNPTKCTFGARLGKLLGFVVSEKGIIVDPDKVRAIQELPPPRTQKEVRGFLKRLNFIAWFISQLTEKCDPIFRLIKKHNLGIWDDGCQKAFDKVKHYLSNPPVLTPPSPDRPLILYLTVFDNSMGCLRGQHDGTGRKEKKAIKGSAIVDFLASIALKDYEPLNLDFSNKDLMYVATTEEDTSENSSWKLNFDGASNEVGNGIGAVLISLNRDHYSFTCKLDFDCTNNMAEYETCIMGICVAIDRKIKVLEVYGDSTWVIYQLKGEWETRDPKLISYRKLVLELIEQFDDITFFYLPRDENQMADALATLASMIRINKQGDMKPIQMSICDASAHCCNIDEEEERDNHPWYHDILRYVKNREYPDQATENDKRMLRRLANDYILDGEILYKKRKDQILLRYVDAVEAKKILEEVHEGVYGTHANGFTMARQIIRFGYYWSTMEGDCISYAKKCHKCQIYGDKIHVPPSPLHNFYLGNAFFIGLWNGGSFAY